VKKILTQWDAMMVAKHFPGQYDVPYLQGMGVSTAHTGIISTPYSAQNCWDYTIGSMQPPGTRKFQILAWCPILTAYYGDGSAGAFPTNSKLGGAMFC